MRGRDRLSPTSAGQAGAEGVVGKDRLLNEATAAAAGKDWELVKVKPSG